MFDLMRRMIFPIIIIVLIFFGGLIILEWGAGLSSQVSYTDVNNAAIINGEEISWQVYNRIYNNLYQAEQSKVEDELTDDKVYEIRQTAWAQLLADRLLMQQIQKYDIIVTDDELYQYLRVSPPVDFQQMSAFQTDGQFDYQKYLSTMTDPQAAGFWRSIEPSVRADIAKLKLQEMIVQAAYVSEAEIIKIGIVNVTQNQYRNLIGEPTEEELRNYYDNNNDLFYSEKRAKLDYVIINNQPTDYDWDITYNNIKVIYDSIVAGADFAEMARNYSEDGTAVDGGDLGYFKKGQMVPEFDSLSFSLKKDDITEPFKTRFGWHIIKHHGFRTKDKEKEAHVSHILLKVYASQKTLDEFHNTLEEFRIAAKELGFDTAAGNMELEVRSTRPFTEKTPILEFREDEALKKFAFEAEIGTITDVRSNTRSYYVARVAEHIPAGTMDFEEVQNQVKTFLNSEKLTQLCHDTAQTIYDEILNGTKIEKASKNHGIEYEKTDEITRNSYIKGLGKDPIAVGAAFALEEKGSLSKPVDYGRGTAIFKLLERTPADLTEYNEIHDSLSNVVLYNKRQEMYTQWYTGLVNNSEIVNNIDRVAVDEMP